MSIIWVTLLLFFLTMCCWLRFVSKMMSDRLWERVRCEPIFTILADVFNRDPVETLKLCTHQEVIRQAPRHMKPFEDVFYGLRNQMHWNTMDVQTLKEKVEDASKATEEEIDNFGSEYDVFYEEIQRQVSHLLSTASKLYEAFVVSTYMLQSAMGTVNSAVFEPMNELIAQAQRANANLRRRTQDELESSDFQ